MCIDLLQLEQGRPVSQEESSLPTMQATNVSRERVDTCLQSANLITQDSDYLPALLDLLLHEAKALLLAVSILAKLL